MKKLLALVLVLLLCFSLLACTQTAAPVAEPAGEQPADADEAAPIEPEPVEAEPTPDPDAVITFPYTLADNETVAVTIERYDPDDPQGPVLTLRYENRMADQALDFSLWSCVINGFLVEYLETYPGTVEPGAEAEFRMQYPVEALAESGINYIEQLAFTLNIATENHIERPC